MLSGRKLAVAIVTALGLITLAAPQAASPKRTVDEEDRTVEVGMKWWVKEVNVARDEDGQQDILKGDGKPFGRVTINMITPEEDIGAEEKRVSFTLFPWRGHRGRDVSGYIGVRNTIIEATSSWQKERVELDGDGVFRQQDQDEGTERRYRGQITKFSGVLTCYYATRTCTGKITVRGWFEPLVKD